MSACKILEEHISKQIDDHIERHNLSNDKQWGYKKGRSTELLLLNMTEHWKIALDSGKMVRVLFIDFKKAFDSVNHNILLSKVQGVGITGDLYQRLKDYLTGRQQFTDLNGVYSNTQTVGYGVPQGSLLGPRLFKIYVDDLPDKITEGNDTTGYVTANNIDIIVDKFNQLANEIHQWCSKNKLTAHLGKTEVMTIAQRPFTGPVKPIYFGGEQVKMVITTQSLGLNIDNRLTWKHQHNRVTKSFSAKLRQLKRM